VSSSIVKKSDDGLDVTCYRGIGSFLFAMDLDRSRTSNLAGFSITLHKNYFIIPANPATGIVYITENSPDYISGHVRLVSYPTQPMTILTFYLG
jgi:hypothetical protein